MTIPPLNPIGPPQPPVDASTEPRLSTWFSTPPVRWLEGAELRAAWEELDPPDHDPHLATLHPYRVAVGWRLTRAVATARGLIADDDPVTEIGGRDSDPWARGTSVGRARRGRAREDPRLQVAVRPLSDANAPLLPPSTYDGWTPAAVRGWCRAMTAVAARYEMGAHVHGARGLRRLLEPGTLERLYPTREEIEAFEEVALEEVLRFWIAEGQRAATEQLGRHYGWRPEELEGLFGLLRRRAEVAAQVAIDQAKGLAHMRWEDYARRARAAADLRNEGLALKQLDSIHGLTRTEPEDPLAALVGVVRRVAGESRPRAAPTLMPPVDALEEAREGAEDAEFLELDERDAAG